MRAAPYYRVSSPQQVKEGFGFDAQKRLLPQYCRQQGWEIAKVYEEPGISGDSLIGRPAIMQLLADAQNGEFDVIITIEDTRLSRGQLRDWEYVKAICDEHEVSLATPTGGIYYRPGNEDDDFVTDIRGAVSKREKRQIQRRLKNGRDEAIQQGYLCHSVAPYGYEFERFGRKGCHKRLVIVPEQAEVVRLIFRIVAFGLEGKALGVARVAHYLNEIGIPAPRGGQWRPQVVNRMIRHTIYRGEWGWAAFERPTPESKTATRAMCRRRPADAHLTVTNPEAVPAIVAPELWAAANAALDHRTKHLRGRTAEKHPRGLLTSYVRCPHCKYLFHHHQAAKGGTRWYLCKGRNNLPATNLTERCPAQRWRAEVLEGAVWAEIVRVIRSPELLRELVEAGEPERTASPADEARLLQEQLTRNEAAVARVKAAYRADTYSLEELQAELEIIRQERETLSGRLRDVGRRVEAHSEWETAVTSAIALCQDYRQLVDHATHEEKRRIIEDLVTEIEVDREGAMTLHLVFGSSRTARAERDLEQVSKHLRQFTLPARVRAQVCAR